MSRYEREAETWKAERRGSAAPAGPSNGATAGRSLQPLVRRRCAKERSTRLLERTVKRASCVAQLAAAREIRPGALRQFYPVRWHLPSIMSSAGQMRSEQHAIILLSCQKAKFRSFRQAWPQNDWTLLGANSLCHARSMATTSWSRIVGTTSETWPGDSSTRGDFPLTSS